MSYDSELKFAIANSLFSDHKAKLVFKEVTQHPLLSPDVLDIECTRNGNLSLRIKVKTQKNGTHYYNVKVSEEQ